MAAVVALVVMVVVVGVVTVAVGVVVRVVAATVVAVVTRGEVVGTSGVRQPFGGVLVVTTGCCAGTKRPIASKGEFIKVKTLINLVACV